MTFEDLDKRMRLFETAHDHQVLPGLFMVARLDGRSFTRLTRELHAFDAPYDQRFRDSMVATVQRLMTCGFGVVYGYTQSDEISLLLRRDEQTFARKLRKLNSVLAGEASAAFTHSLGAPAAFDCRVSQLPREQDVLEYFLWRQEDAHRNSLSGHCYWALRAEGATEAQATLRLQGATVSQRHELLFARGVNFHALPMWQKRGIGLYWESVERAGHNPKTGLAVTTSRQRLKVDVELPHGVAYQDMVATMVERAACAHQ